MYRYLKLCLAVLFFTAGGVAASAQDAPKRSITKISGDLYRFQNNFHYSVFLVTADGVMVTDPINAGAARWLKAEIAKRFAKPIRYVIYSHDHRDHIAGGEVFAEDGALVVAHERAKAVIIGEKRPTAVPQITFRRKLTLELGGQVVELVHVGRNHSNNMIVMRFPKERVLFAVDFIPVKTVPYRNLSDSYLPEWIRSLRRVEFMDFDILAPGHGAMGTKADVAAMRGYLTDLYKQVLAQARMGKSLAETKAAVDLSQYKDWGQFQAWSPLNIEGAYRQVQMHRRGN
ncbi:MAG: MBL fold metallo-hydrolase [Alphaproteobacteria bacterium]|jgi:glyoxylase-like metal-dependent hydrolase (beta-lactamase superfamily II)|nr:MBL fold metallo-hydrolase [Alphaproteobacteria bacterium]MDP6829444.1 MBL fold metallo-hydrolase [Alphaproteobacteria bacterium]